ncbi:ABC transporter substrate-binding protein [Williamsia sp.]|uniref:ABC transporter substrate-binding protein n=1 Tax=Williamsia sp. TaxID=1872085 RepID=UPI002F93ECF9
MPISSPPRTISAAGRRRRRGPGSRAFGSHAIIGVAALVAALLTACSDGGNDDDRAVADRDCIVGFDADTDYYPEKLSIDYADNFDLDYQKSYVVATVNGASPDQKDTFVFARCGAPTPELTGDLAGATVIESPATSLFLGSTTQLAALAQLDELDVVTGFANSEYVYGEAESKAVASLPQYAPTGEIDPEMVVTAKPQLLITDYPTDRSLEQIEKAGVPVMINSDWLEVDPLGRAEWIKLFAALTNTEEAANDFFDGVTTDYNNTKAKVGGTAPVEAVLGLPYQGTWYIPGGGSYGAALMKAAGITYAWADNPSTGSISEDIDTVYSRAGNAPLALSSESTATLADAIATDPRIAQFAAYRDNNAWSASAQVNEAGANNYFELGAIRPDLSLADLIAIAHPELMPDHTFTFYKKLT